MQKLQIQPKLFQIFKIINIELFFRSTTKKNLNNKQIDVRQWMVIPLNASMLFASTQSMIDSC